MEADEDTPLSPTEARARLMAAGARAHTQLTALQSGFSSIVESTELSATDDEHDPEGATIAFERALVSSGLESTRAESTAIAEALSRIAEGTYGRCEQCGADIAPGRLRARPTARTCIRCAR